MIGSRQRAIIRRHQDDAPVNVISIAKELGINVWKSSDLGPGISGQLLPDLGNGGPAGYSIIVSATDGLSRQRFTIAHEIGHFLLHRDKVGSGVTDDVFLRSGLSTRAEGQANRFAAHLLMPEHLVLRYMKLGKVTSPEELAKLFAVSPSAMRIRIEVLTAQKSRTFVNV